MTKALEEAIVAQETNGNEYNQTCQIPLLTEKIKEKLNHKKSIKNPKNVFLNCILGMNTFQNDMIVDYRLRFKRPYRF